MIEKLVDIKEILDLLGYEDERSVISWCSKNKIPVIKMGKINYVLINFIETFIETELNSFIKMNYDNSEEILTSIQNDDKLELTKLLKAPVSNKVKKEYEKEKKRGSSASDFLKNIKKVA